MPSGIDQNLICSHAGAFAPLLDVKALRKGIGAVGGGIEWNGSDSFSAVNITVDRREMRHNNTLGVFPTPSSAVS